MPCGSSYSNYSLTSQFAGALFCAAVSRDLEIFALKEISGCSVCKRQDSSFYFVCYSFGYFCYTSFLFATLRPFLRGSGQFLACAALLYWRSSRFVQAALLSIPSRNFGEGSGDSKTIEGQRVFCVLLYSVR